MRKHYRPILYTLLLVFFLFSPLSGNPHFATIPSTTASQQFVHFVASPAGADQPSLQNFIESVKNDDAALAVGVYLPDQFALPILQQPANQPAFVSTTPDTVTQFRLAATYKTIGLLAHNNLAGEKFSHITRDQTVYIVFGNGNTKEYTISSVRKFQALEPESPYSDFVDLDQPEKKLSSTQLFNEIFTKGDRVVFQTCLAKDGNASWGRIFITALPVPPPSSPTNSPDFFQEFLMRISRKIASGS